jgi:MFS family permease
MNRALALIVLAEFFGTSVWFSGNAAAAALAREWDLSPGGRGALLSSVQVGFILGTLTVALTGWADAWRASRIFAVSAVAASVANAGFALLSSNLIDAFIWRLITGAALAGVYPLGMKLIVTWAPQRAGETLAWLVGALTLGTASPHLIRGLGHQWPWQSWVLTASAFALIAAGLVGWLGDGPASPVPIRPRWGAIAGVFKRPRFRASALGYFGHMWELYAFWFLVPVMVAAVLGSEGAPAAIGAFAIMAAGAIGCVVGGMLSRRIGGARVAAIALFISGIACLVYPMLGSAHVIVKLTILLVWGVAVVADSPQFSALSATACGREEVGAALAVQNGVGFLITTLAIQTVAACWDDLGPRVAWILAPGPWLGLLALRPLMQTK